MKHELIIRKKEILRTRLTPELEKELRVINITLNWL